MHMPSGLRRCSTSGMNSRCLFVTVSKLLGKGTILCSLPRNECLLDLLQESVFSAQAVALNFHVLHQVYHWSSLMVIGHHSIAGKTGIDNMC